MPKNKVSDPITDQEMAFARLVLSPAMTDRHAAEAVGLNPDSAAHTKAKPRVRAYMLPILSRHSLKTNQLSGLIAISPVGTAENSPGRTRISCGLVGVT